MSDGDARLRLVIDTNVWLDWLVFADPDVAPIREAVAAGRIEVVTDDAVEAELERVLAYSFGARTLTAEARAECLAHCRRIAVRHEDSASRAVPPGAAAAEPGIAGGDSASPASPEPRRLPVCADPDDQKFLDLALACGAAYLVTRDRDILELARDRDPRPPFRIVTPRQFLAAMRR